jgi:putative transposase
MVTTAMQRYAISERRACGLMNHPRATERYVSRKPSDEALRRRMRELASDRPRYGYRRIHVLLRREGWRLNCERAG